MTGQSHRSIFFDTSQRHPVRSGLFVALAFVGVTGCGKTWMTPPQDWLKQRQVPSAGDPIAAMPPGLNGAMTTAATKPDPAMGQRFAATGAVTPNGTPGAAPVVAIPTGTVPPAANPYARVASSLQADTAAGSPSPYGSPPGAGSNGANGSSGGVAAMPSTQDSSQLARQVAADLYGTAPANRSAAPPSSGAMSAANGSSYAATSPAGGFQPAGGPDKPAPITAYAENLPPTGTRGGVAPFADPFGDRPGTTPGANRYSFSDQSQRSPSGANPAAPRVGEESNLPRPNGVANAPWNLGGTSAPVRVDDLMAGTSAKEPLPEVGPTAKPLGPQAFGTQIGSLDLGESNGPPTAPTRPTFSPLSVAARASTATPSPMAAPGTRPGVTFVPIQPVGGVSPTSVPSTAQNAPAKPPVYSAALDSLLKPNSPASSTPSMTMERSGTATNSPSGYVPFSTDSFFNRPSGGTYR